MKNNCIYKIVVVEDEPLILENVVEKIKSTGLPFEVSGQALNGLDALALIDSVRPDVVITDIKMPMLDGLGLIREVSAKYKDTHLVILSGYNEFDYAQQAIKYGVKDYLLKPLTLESLQGVLNKIYQELEYMSNTFQKTALISALNTPQFGCKIQSLNDCGFFLFLVCIGNKCNNIPLETVIGYYSAYLQRIPWKSILSQTFNDVENFWLIDERYYNEKIILVSCRQGITLDSISIANQLKNTLYKYVEPLNVTVCTNNRPVSFSELWVVAQKARTMINERLIAWKSKIISLNHLNSHRLDMRGIEPLTENKILACIHSNSKSLLKKQLHDMFEKWVKAQYPQRLIEKSIIQLSKVLFRKAINLAEAEASNFELELLKTLATTKNFPDFFEMVWTIIDNALFRYINESDSTKQLVDDVEGYIRINFAEDISLETIANRFSINPSHLTRLFKRYKGKTPLKYLISLRIEEAKKLITEQPELDLKDISEIVGYSDQHYFSRIFKNVVGKSPSEYRYQKIFHQ
ncbi:MAG: response regulator transcription factor [Acetivibrionales bacterium]